MTERDTQHICFKLDPIVIRQAKALARERDLSVSQLLRHLLRRELEASQPKQAA